MPDNPHTCLKCALMPFKPRSRCLNVADGCPNHALTGQSRCGPCQRAHDRQRNKRRTHYQGNWKARAAQQTRNIPWCECPGCPKCAWQRPIPSCRRHFDLTADHIAPGDPSSPLRTLCRPCNSSRGDRVA